MKAMCYHRTLKRVPSEKHYQQFFRVMRGVDRKCINRRAAVSSVQKLFEAYPQLIAGFNELRLCGRGYTIDTPLQLAFGRLLIFSILVKYDLAVQVLFFAVRFGRRAVRYPG